MTTRTLSAALLLYFILSAAAFAESGDYELYADDIRLPVTQRGFISHRGCASECDYRRVRLARDAEFRVNGRTVDYEALRKAFARAQGTDDVTVLHDERERVILISIYVSE